MKLATTLICALTLTLSTALPNSTAQAAEGFPFVGTVTGTADRDGNGADDLWAIDVFNTGFVIFLVDRPGMEKKQPKGPAVVGDKVGFYAWPLKAKVSTFWRLLDWVGKLP